MSATPQFNMATTTFIAIPDENPFKPFTEAFTIEILNDYAYGGCGYFSCTAYCQNDVNQMYMIDSDTKVLAARRSVITLGVLYNLEVTCIDEFDYSFISDDHSLNADLTFVLTMPTFEPTTSRTYTSTTIRSVTPEPTTLTTFKSTPIKASSTKSAALTTPASINGETAIRRIPFLSMSSISTTAPVAASDEMHNGFFDKPANVAAVVALAVAFSCLTVFVISYVIYKKVVNKQVTIRS